MKTTKYRATNKEEYDIILQLLHGGRAVVPRTMQASTLNNILGEINKYNTNIIIEMTGEGLILKKINPFYINPLLRKSKQ